MSPQLYGSCQGSQAKWPGGQATGTGLEFPARKQPACPVWIAPFRAIDLLQRKIWRIT